MKVKRILVGTLATLGLCSLLFGQTLTYKFHATYNNGNDSFVRDLQPIIPLTNTYRLASATFALTNWQFTSFSLTPTNGPSFWYNLGTNSIQLSIDGTNAFAIVSPGEFATFRTTSVTYWYRSWPTNGNPVVPIAFDILGGP